MRKYHGQSSQQLKINVKYGCQLQNNTYHGAIDNIEYRQTSWAIEFRRASAIIRAQCTDHRVVVDGAKANDAMAVRHEDFPRRRNHGDTYGTLQRAVEARQLPHPRAIQSPQHRHPTVALIRHEEEIFVGGERQATQVI